jgi:hypothetical protein
MGNAISADSATPDRLRETLSAKRATVRERHDHALFLCIPLKNRLAERLAAPSERVSPARYKSDGSDDDGNTPEEGDMCCWLVCVVDALDTLHVHVAMDEFLPSGTGGWMAKACLLVDVDGGDDDDDDVLPATLPAYQILELVFEDNMSGAMRVAGAQATQHVPTFPGSFVMSSEDSTARRAELVSGAPVRAEIQAPPGEAFLRLFGTLAELTAAERAFAEFVLQRPTKVLAQQRKDGSVVSTAASATGPGACFSCERARRVAIGELEFSALRRVLGAACESDLELPDIENDVFAFAVPYFTIVDHDNVEI